MEIARKQQSLVSLGDVVNQLSKLAEENSFTEPENNVKEVTEALQDLGDQLSVQKASTQVSFECIRIKCLGLSVNLLDKVC